METLYTSVAVVRDTARVAKVRGRESPRSRWHHRYHGHGLHRDLDQWFAIKMFKNNQKQRRRFSTIFFKFSDLKSYNIIDRLLKYKYEIHLRNIEFITFLRKIWDFFLNFLLDDISLLDLTISGIYIYLLFTIVFNFICSHNIYLSIELLAIFVGGQSFTVFDVLLQ